MRNLIPAIVAIVIATVAPTVAAGPCDLPIVVRLVQENGGEKPRASNDEQMLEFVANIAMKAGVTTPIVCEYDHPTKFLFPLLPSNSKGQARIMVPRGIHEMLSPKGLRGALAHEIAHIVLRHVGSLPTLEQRVNREMEADRLATEWVGEETILATLEEAAAYYERISKAYVLENFRPRILAARRGWS